MTSIRQFLTRARQLWWIIPVCIVVGVAASEGLGAIKAGHYIASSQVLITAGDGGSSASPSSSNAQLNVADAQLIAQSAAFYRAAAAPLKVGWEALQKSISVSNPPNTDALQFVAAAASAPLAVQDANGVAYTFSEYYTAFLHSGNAVGTGTAVQVVSHAYRATGSTGGTLRYGAVGVVAGLVIALLVLAFLESTDRGLRLPPDLGAALGTSAVCVLGDRSGEDGDALVQLRREIAARSDHHSSTRIGVLAVGQDRAGALEVACLVAGGFAAQGLAVTVYDAAELASTTRGAVDIGVGSLMDAPFGEIASDVTVWLLVVLLGQSTEKEIGAVRRSLVAAGIEQSRAVGVCLSLPALVP